MTVFGAGRDQGMTSSPTVAIAAAVLGIPYRITFGGSTLFQYAQDVAGTLILASRSEPMGARIFNLGGNPVSIDEWIAAVDAAVPGAADLLTYDPTPLPFPAEIDHARLRELGDVPLTPHHEAIAATAAIFRTRAAEGLLDALQQGIPGPDASPVSSESAADSPTGSPATT
jgi:nucleoside-diphosphate-sugar epimerase